MLLITQSNATSLVGRALDVQQSNFIGSPACPTFEIFMVCETHFSFSPYHLCFRWTLDDVATAIKCKDFNSQFSSLVMGAKSFFLSSTFGIESVESFKLCLDTLTEILRHFKILLVAITQHSGKDVEFSSWISVNKELPLFVGSLLSISFSMSLINNFMMSRFVYSNYAYCSSFYLVAATCSHEMRKL